MKIEKAYSQSALRPLIFWLLLTNFIFPMDAERNQRLARVEKNLGIAKVNCGTEAVITVQLSVDNTVTGVCLFLSVDYITMRVAGKDYSFSLGSDITEISDTVATAATGTTAKQEEQLRRYEIQRLESHHAIGIRFLDLNLLEDPFKFGKVALNYELRFWFLSLFLEGGADFKAGVAQNGKKYDAMAQLRWLFGKAFDTFYVGVFVNYQTGATTQNDADGEKRDVEIRAYSLGGLFGKRWVFRNGIFLDLTLRAGPYIETIASRAQTTDIRCAMKSPALRFGRQSVAQP